MMVRQPCTDEAVCLAVFRVYHDEETLAIRESHRYPAFFVLRMIGVRDGDGEGVGKNGRRFSEIDPVLSWIAPGFPGVPFKLDRH